jgi:hypothetical protein
LVPSTLSQNLSEHDPLRGFVVLTPRFDAPMRESAVLSVKWLSAWHESKFQAPHTSEPPQRLAVQTQVPLLQD